MQPNTTAGITYNIGQDSSNELNSIQTTMAFNPQPTNAYISQPTNNPEITKSNIKIPSNTESNTESNTTNKILDHPPFYDDTVIHKCRADAIYNSTKITQAQKLAESEAELYPETTFFGQTQPETTLSNKKSSSIFQKYKILFIILIVLVILLIIGIVVYKFILNKKTSNNNSNFNSNSNSK
jgi:hypothetical protein